VARVWPSRKRVTRQLSTATGFPSLPPPPQAEGYAQQIYMNMLPPGVAGPGIGSDGFRRLSFGLEHPERRHDFRQFDRSFETLAITKIKDRA